MIETVQVLFIFSFCKPTIFVSIKLNLWKNYYAIRFNLFGFLMITGINSFRFFFALKIQKTKQLILGFCVFFVTELPVELLFQKFVVISI